MADQYLSRVRFVQVWAGGWDHHQDIEDRLPERAKAIDGPLAAFITDLKQRNLFDSTLIVWGGEFGRKPVRDRNGNENPGRDHNAKAFSTVLAGGGVRGGMVHGATDEFGAASVQDKVHIDRKSTRLNSSHSQISYAVFCLKKKKKYCSLYRSPHAFVHFISQQQFTAS